MPPRVCRKGDDGKIIFFQEPYTVTFSQIKKLQPDCNLQKHLHADIKLRQVGMRLSVKNAIMIGKINLH